MIRKFIFCLTLLFVILLICFSSYYLFHAKYFGSIEIECKNIPADKISVVANTPLNNQLAFVQNNNSYQYLHKRFYRNIIITKNDSVFENSFLVIHLDNQKIRIDLSCKTTTIDILDYKIIPSSFLKNLLDFAIFGFTQMKFILIFLTILALAFVAYIFKHLIISSIFNFKTFLETHMLTSSLSITFMLIAYIFLIEKVNFSNVIVTKHYPDQVEYHTCAVNQALGYGFLIGGKVNQDIDYKLVCSDEQALFQYTEMVGMRRLDRFPAYSFILGILYKIFGINPVIIKYLQLALLSIFIFLIPLVSFRIWGKIGYWGGILSMSFLFVYLFDYVDIFTPDLATTVINFFIVYFYFKTRIKFTYKNLIILSALLGISFLLRASLIIFGILVFIDLSIFTIKNPGTKITKLLLFTLIFLACWVPYNIWSISYTRYAKKEATEILKSLNNHGLNNALINKNIESAQNKMFLTYNSVTITPDDIDYYNANIKPDFEKFKFIDLNKDSLIYNNRRNSEGINFLIKLEYMKTIPSLYFMIFYGYKAAGLSINNEFNNDGTIHPEWASSKSSFYNTDMLSDQGEIYRIVNFYLHNPAKIFSITNAKLNSYFSKAYHISIFVLAVFLFLMLSILYKANEYINASTHFRTTTIIFLLGVSALVFLIKGITPYLFLMSLVFCLYDKTLKEIITKPLLFMFTNLFLLPVILYGNPRFMIYYDTFLFVMIPVIIINANQGLKHERKNVTYIADFMQFKQEK